MAQNVTHEIKALQSTTEKFSQHVLASNLAFAAVAIAGGAPSTDDIKKAYAAYKEALKIIQENKTGGSFAC